METKKLPAVKDIKWDDIESYGLKEKQNIAIRNYILNQSPPEKWLKKHPLYNNIYLPIDKVEYLLTNFFGRWHVEVKSIFQIINSVVCIVKLHYYDSETNGYLYQDGAGAAPIQTDSGFKATDTENVKSIGVMLAVPNAKTNAVKDAADVIGRVFGRDLNRKNILSYNKQIENIVL